MSWDKKVEQAFRSTKKGESTKGSFKNGAMTKRTEKLKEKK